MKAIGFIGNVLLYFVYSHGRRLNQLSVSVYFKSMALFSCLQISFHISSHFNWYKMFNKSRVPIMVLNYFIRLFLLTTVWLQVVVTLDRLLTILFSIRFPFLKRRFFHRLVVASVIAYNTVLYLTILIITSSRIEMNIKETRSFRNLKRIIDLCNSTLLPFLLILSFSVATFAAMVRTHRHLNSLGPEPSRLKKRSRRDIKFGMTLIVVNLTFVIFMVIDRLNLNGVLNPFDNSNQYLAYLVFNMIIVQFSDAYYILNFYVQLLVNSLVRRECRRLFRRIVCRRRPRTIQPTRSVSFSRGRSIF